MSGPCVVHGGSNVCTGVDLKLLHALVQPAEVSVVFGRLNVLLSERHHAQLERRFMERLGLL